MGRFLVRPSRAFGLHALALTALAAIHPCRAGEIAPRLDPAPGQTARVEAPDALRSVMDRPWMNRRLPLDGRARLLVAAMTLDEKIGLLHTSFGVPMRGHPKPAGALDSAGFAPGIARLGLPPLQETDAGLGIANPTSAAYDATPLPSGLALGATFDPALAEKAGAMIGGEARAMGFSVLLGGGANLTRDPRGGRNFEYIGEDPLLTGVMAGASVAGIQSRGIVSTLKHFALNAQENGRVVLNAELAEAPARESDLLAFEIAIERGRPGAVMTGYNRVGGTFASENAGLIEATLKSDWGFAGWVMSDWSATHSTETAALAGLDQESGIDNDPILYFGAPLMAAAEAGRVPMARLDDMARRILRAQLAAGLIDDPPRPGGAIDFAADARVAEAVAENGIVLLKNEHDTLPLKAEVRRVLVVGAKADQGVLSGGGSSQVVPKGAIRVEGNPPGKFWGVPMLYDPSSPVEALKRERPCLVVTYLDGHDVHAAALAAKDADVAIVFAEQWMNESRDAPDLSLPKDQDALIAAVAAVNSRTIVVLETGGPVTMPWLGAVPAVIEAWYPGARGGEAIAGVLTGRVNPSGHLPITFPASEAQLPRPVATPEDANDSNPGEAARGKMFSVDYNIEGADVGYKWYLRKRETPLFPFGFGLSFTRFAIADVEANAANGTLAVTFDVTNIGAREGIATPQVYVDAPAFTRRLVGCARLSLKPGEHRRVALRVDARLLASFDTAAHDWRIAGGPVRVAVRQDALADASTTRVVVPARTWSARHDSAPRRSTLAIPR